MQAEFFAKMYNVVPVEAYFNYKDVYEAFNDNLWGGTKLRAVLVNNLHPNWQEM